MPPRSPALRAELTYSPNQILNSEPGKHLSSSSLRVNIGGWEGGRLDLGKRCLTFAHWSPPCMLYTHPGQSVLPPHRSVFPRAYSGPSPSSPAGDVTSCSPRVAIWVQVCHIPLPLQACVISSFCLSFALILLHTVSASLRKEKTKSTHPPDFRTWNTDDLVDLT